MASWLRPAAALVLILALCATPLTGDAQTRPGRIPKVGYVFARRAAEDQRVWDAARQGLRELGLAQADEMIE